jgi:hypothetical protein
MFSLLSLEAQRHRHACCLYLTVLADLSIIFDMLPHPVHTLSRDIHTYMSGATRFRTFLDCTIAQLRDFIIEKVTYKQAFAAAGL